MCSICMCYSLFREMYGVHFMQPPLLLQILRRKYYLRHTRKMLKNAVLRMQILITTVYIIFLPLQATFCKWWHHHLRYDEICYHEILPYYRVPARSIPSSYSLHYHSDREFLKATSIFVPS